MRESWAWALSMIDWAMLYQLISFLREHGVSLSSMCIHWCVGGWWWWAKDLKIDFHKRWALCVSLWGHRLEATKHHHDDRQNNQTHAWARSQRVHTCLIRVSECPMSKMDAPKFVPLRLFFSLRHSSLFSRHPPFIFTYGEVLRITCCSRGIRGSQVSFLFRKMRRRKPSESWEWIQPLPSIPLQAKCVALYCFFM